VIARISRGAGDGEVLDERRLSRARLAGHEHDLALALEARASCCSRRSISWLRLTSPTGDWPVGTPPVGQARTERERTGRLGTWVALRVVMLATKR
jgi:hypothetical protein